MPSWRCLFLRLDGTYRAGWKALLFLGIHAFALSGVGAFIGQDVRSEPWLPWLWGQLALTLLLSGVFLYLEERPLASLGLRFDRGWGVHLLAGLAGGFLLMGSVALIIHGWQGFHWVYPPQGGLSALGSGAWLFLAVALGEELLFRGYAFQRLAEALGGPLALGMTALWFAQAHWDNPGMTGPIRGWAILNIALAGILLGLAFLKTRSLALPIGLHLGWNWTQGSLLGFGVSGTSLRGYLQPVFQERPLWLTGGSFGLEASLPCTILCGLAIAGLVLWKPRGGCGSGPLH